MAWTAPRTWVAGEIVTAALMNTHVRDDLRYLKGLDGVPTVESGLTIDNTDGDERLLLPLLSTSECTTVLNAEGEVAFDETTHRIKYYDNNSVVSVVGTDDVDDTPVNGATTDPISSNWAYDFINTLTTQSDLPYATAAGVWTRLAKGTGSQYLRMDSGATAPEWATVALSTASGFYTGNNTYPRQVTTGFICKFVIIIMLSGGSNPPSINVLIPSATWARNTVSQTDETAHVTLHATDGIDIIDGLGTVLVNSNSVVYFYYAFG